MRRLLPLGWHQPQLEGIVLFFYQKATNEWSTPEGQELILQAIQSVNAPLFDSLVAHRTNLGRRCCEQVVSSRITRMVYDNRFGDAPTKPEKAKKLIRRATQWQQTARLSAIKCDEHGNWERLSKLDSMSSSGSINKQPPIHTGSKSRSARLTRSFQTGKQQRLRFGLHARKNCKHLRGVGSNCGGF